MQLMSETRQISFIAEYTAITVPIVFDTENNILQSRMIMLNQLRVRRAQDYISLLAGHDTYTTGQIDVQIKPEVNWYEIELENGLSLSILPSSQLYVFDMIQGKPTVKSVEQLDRTTDLILIDASAAFSEEILMSDETGEGENESLGIKRLPCKRCLKAYIYFRMLIEKGKWPTITTGNRLISNSDAYTIVDDNEGKKHVATTIKAIKEKSEANRMVTKLYNVKGPIVVDGILIV